jgi:hypothetical protein
MLLFHWNALRIGDRVLVHNDDDPAAPLAEGTVTLIQTGAAHHPNDLAIRITHGGGGVIRPRRHAVHFMAGGTSDCWRCAAHAEIHAEDAA